MPCGTPPHKSPAGLAPAPDRLAMVELAVKGLLGLECSAVEVERPGVSYTIDTLQWLKRALGREIVFIIGADTLDELASWREVKALVSEFRFAVVARPGYLREVPAELERKIGGKLAEKLRGSVVKIEPAPVSSTVVRERLSSGEAVSGMVRASVEVYIRTHGLYGTSRSGEE